MTTQGQEVVLRIQVQQCHRSRSIGTGTWSLESAVFASSHARSLNRGDSKKGDHQTHRPSIFSDSACAHHDLDSPPAAPFPPSRGETYQ